MKKIFTFFLVLVTSMGIVYASDTQVDGIWYDFDSYNHTASVTYRGSNYYSYDHEYSGNVVIPSSITYNGTTYSVTSIGERAFEYCSSLTSVTIPNSVTSIGGWTFCDCSSLTSITIPNSVESIGDGTFSVCRSLTSITIPNSVTSIGGWTFSGCYFTKDHFINNSSLDAEANYYWGATIVDSDVDGILIKDKVVIKGRPNITFVVIPNGVTSIGDWAFNGCSKLTSITIPNSVTSIGSAAFSVCRSLTSITIPNSVTCIGDTAFSSCTSLEYLYIPNSVQYTEEEYYYDDGYRCIRNCPNLKTLIVPADFFAVGGNEANYQHVKSDVFPYLPERLESLTINDGTIHRLAWDFISRNHKTLKTIDLATTTDIAIAEEAFKNCYKLENLALPSQLEYIPYMAIAECVKLQSITIPATVTEIEDRAFENCRSIKTIIFEGSAPAQGPAHHAAASGSSLWRIGSWAFYNCHQLQNLTIPEGVIEVGDAAFYGCTYLEDMVLPSTIQEIGDNGFALCAKLKKIHVKATTPPTIQAKTFFDVNRQIPVYVPDNAVEAYKDDPYWQEFDIQGESKAPSAVDNIPSAVTNTQKIIRDGHFIIVRDGVEYNAVGQELGN